MPANEQPPYNRDIHPNKGYLARKAAAMLAAKAFFAGKGTEEGVETLLNGLSEREASEWRTDMSPDTEKEINLTVLDTVPERPANEELDPNRFDIQASEGAMNNGGPLVDNFTQELLKSVIEEAANNALGLKRRESDQ